MIARTGLFGNTTLLMVITGLLSAVTTVGAQIRILPRTSSPGAMESYVLRVSNDHQQAITRIELRFPQSVRITSLGEKPDWPAQVLGTGTKLSSVIWTGTLSPGRYGDFGFIGVNPAKPVTLVWPVIVTFADGERAAWWTGNIAHKAPTTVVRNPTAFNSSLALALAVCVVALVLALTALGLSLRSGSSAPPAFGRDGG